MKMRRAFLVTFLVPALLGGLVACTPEAEQLESPELYERRAVLEKFQQQLRHAFADCSTTNNTPIAPCADWITGPASAENPGISMYRWDQAAKTWHPATLHETDGGWPIMSPDGESLELLAYGDTWVENPVYTTADRQSEIQLCAKQSVESICKLDEGCKAIFQAMTDKMEACAFWLAKRDHRYPGTGLVLTAFDEQNNVVFFDAEIDAQNSYRFKFKGHLRDKAIRHNTMENTHKALAKKPFTGVYATDSFYLCPKASTGCGDSDKVLYFLSQTVYWHLHERNPSKLKPVEKYFKLTREGMGFYRFGTLAAKMDKSAGCRVPFAPPVPLVSCPSNVAGNLHTEDPLFTAPGNKVERSLNPNVLWAWGSKFSHAIVMHGFVDPRHADASKSQDYVYFLGSGERRSWIDNAAQAARYAPTANVYMARLPAREDALFKGQFEYYRGTVGGTSLWGTFDQAKPLLNTLVKVFPSSFTKRHGRYFLAASCGLGMCVSSSKDGYLWDKADYASYSDVTGDDAATDFVYGYAWVPAGLYPHADAIPYVFSVWKGRGGYAADFWFKGKPKEPIPLAKRFHFYNTKMYLYWPQ
jgi:hypothetical protein